MKTLLKLFLLLAAVVYWGYTFIHSPKVENDVVCSKVELSYADSVTDGFIDKAEVEKMLKKENLHPVGKKLDSIKGKAIVACLLKSKYIKIASCYKTPQGVVNIEIAQRKPILRVMPNDGEDYYIDAEGTQLSTSDYLA
ncbi:MAG: cell division protein, partial [Bacteroidaceae bacterium]|nr:cell division protein [Bacteroidaceae bacterium]